MFGPLTRTLKITVSVIAVYSAVVGFLPLCAGPTYEAGLAAGAFYPLVIAVAMAVFGTRAGLVPTAAINAGATLGACSGVAGLVVFLLHGLRGGFCEPLLEAAHFVLAPVSGSVLAGVWGACAALIAGVGSTRGRLPLAVILAALAPLGGIAVSLWRFYTSPIIFAFDPFFGFFAGTLYDTVIDAIPRLLTYRAGSLATLLGVFALSGAFVRGPSGRLGFDVTRRPVTSALGGLCILASIVITLEGPSLGHYQTAASIRAELGRTAEARRCVVVYAAGIRPVEVHALARDCDAHVDRIEKYLEVQGTPKITVFLFANADQKAALMGARNTYIAKPWRSEIYLQHQAFPHPVMGHELAHVVAGQFGVGPFHIAGPLGGWLPDPGRIEGMAVAAGPRDESDLSTMEWAAAMKKLELLPRLQSVFRLTFLGENASTAYTVAGAFIEWLRKEHGVDTVKRWYAGESLEGLTTQPFTQLETRFQAALDQVRVSDAALAVAKARFERPAIFARRCPHSVDRLYGEASFELASFRPERARELFDEALALDPGNFAARISLANCAVAAGDTDAAMRTLKELTTDESFPAATRAAAWEGLGDLALRSSKSKEAASYYDHAEENVVSEGARRMLDVKRAAASSDHLPAVLELLLPDPMLGADWGAAASALTAWSYDEPKNGLADYLLGKNHFNHGRWKLAAEHLDRALDRDLSIKSVKKEALRVRVLAACALGHGGSAGKWVKRYGALKPRASQRQALQRVLERCQVHPKEGH